MAAPTMTMPELLDQFRGALLAVGEKLQSTSRVAKPEASQHVRSSHSVKASLIVMRTDCQRGPAQSARGSHLYGCNQGYSNVMPLS